MKDMIAAFSAQATRVGAVVHRGASADAATLAVDVARRAGGRSVALHMVMPAIHKSRQQVGPAILDSTRRWALLSRGRACSIHSSGRCSAGSVSRSRAPTPPPTCYSAALQRISAEQIHLSPTLMAAANSSGGVMGKMIDAQSIVVASTATQWYGHEGEILRDVFFHSIALAALVGVLVFLQAYIAPFTWLVVR